MSGKKKKKRKFSKPKAKKRLPISLSVATSLVPLSLTHTIINKWKQGISTCLFVIPYA